MQPSEIFAQTSANQKTSEKMDNQGEKSQEYVAANKSGGSGKRKHRAGKRDRDRMFSEGLEPKEKKPPVEEGGMFLSKLSLDGYNTFDDLVAAIV